jgi:quercetin dioxygenase-like cupin family protein
MAKVIRADQVKFENVDWGLTKELIGPKSVGAKSLKVKITEYLPGYSHKPHIHPHQEEVIFILSGRGIAEGNGEETEIGPGSVVFVPAGQPHATYNLSASESMKAVIIKSPPDDEEVRMDETGKGK